jgi:hypothetical protein
MKDIVNEYHVNKLARDAKKRATFNKLIQMKKAVLAPRFLKGIIKRTQSGPFYLETM